jgi:hypothetical protein
VAIIGILARDRDPAVRGVPASVGTAASSSADIRNGATGQEAYFVDHQTYGSVCSALPGFTKSALTTMTCNGTSSGLHGVRDELRRPELHLHLEQREQSSARL